MERERSWTQRLLQWVTAPKSQRHAFGLAHPLPSLDANAPKDRRPEAVLRKLREAGGL